MNASGMTSVTSVKGSTVRQGKQKGFTLIELMIVAMIIGILGALMLPYYETSKRKANREDAYNRLNEVLQAQERFYANVIPHTYTLDLTQLGYGVATNLWSTDGIYQISAVPCLNGAPLTQCVLLTAVPPAVRASGEGNDQVNDMTGAVPGAPNITIDTQGVRTPNMGGWWGQ